MQEEEEKKRRSRRQSGDNREREKRFCKQRAYHNEACILICWADSEVCYRPLTANNGTAMDEGECA